MPNQMICYCLKITESEIIKSFKKGNKTVKEIMDSTGAGYGCGSCKVRIKKLIEKIEIEK